MKKIIAVCSFVLAVCISSAFAAPNLTSEMAMDVRSETASMAKKEAGESAARGAVIQVLSRYSDRAMVENLLMSAPEPLIQNLITSISIQNEKFSKTAYSATFVITLNRSEVERWYSENNVPNFLSAADESKDKILVYIDLSNGLNDWAMLNQMVRTDGNNYGLILRSILDKSATAYVFANKRRAFLNLVTSNGWVVSNKDGIIRISKNSTPTIINQ